MYHQVESSFLLPEKFEFPNAGRLSEDNRWVILAKLIPRSEFEEKYAENLIAEIQSIIPPPTRRSHNLRKFLGLFGVRIDSDFYCSVQLFHSNYCF